MIPATGIGRSAVPWTLTSRVMAEHTELGLDRGNGVSFGNSSLTEDVVVPGNCLKEFREEGVAVAYTREPVVAFSQIARGFGISDHTLINWL